MIKFSQAKLSDLKGILDVMIDTTYVQFFKKPYEKDLEKDIRERFFFVAKDGKKIIGYAIFTKLQKRFHQAPIKLEKNFLSSAGVGVLSKYRGQGIAIKLKLYSEKQLKKLGFKGIYTDVSSKNKSSLKLQEKLGFEMIAKYKCDFRKGWFEKNCIFRKKL